MPEVRVIVPEDLDRALDALIKAGFAGNKAELTRTALTYFLSTIPTQLPKGYDLETAFSPDGRVFQLEYAIESMKRGGTIVGVRCDEGVVLAKEVPKCEEFMVLPNPFVQIFQISKSVGAVFCGLLTDGYFLIDEALKQARTLEEEGSNDIETLVKRLALFMQPHAQRKDIRPLAVAVILGGLDSKNRARLFLLHSAGLSQEYLACNVGVGGDETKGILKGGYRSELSLDEATMLAIKATLRKHREPDQVLVATISTKDKEFRTVTLEEKQKKWKKIFP